MEWKPSDSNLFKAAVPEPGALIRAWGRNDKAIIKAIEEVGQQLHMDVSQQLQMSELNTLFAQSLLHNYNAALAQAYSHIDRLTEQHLAKDMLMQEAERRMVAQIRGNQRDLEEFARQLLEDELSTPASTMDWEPTVVIQSLDCSKYLDRQVAKNKLHIKQVREDSEHPPAMPELGQGIHPSAFTIPSETAPSSVRTSRRGTPQPGSRTRKITPPLREPREVRDNWEDRMERRFGTLSRSLESRISTLFENLATKITTAQQPAETNPPVQPFPAAPAQPPVEAPVAEGSGARRGSQGTDREEERGETSPSEQEEGGNGGRGGGVGGGGPGGNGDDSPSSSDSEGGSEPDVTRNPRKWKRWYKRRQRALRKARKGKRAAVPMESDHSEEDSKKKPRGRVEKVEAFSGESASYDVEDFLWNLESKFKIEGKAWSSDEARIRFASGCLTGKARSWFRSYRWQVNPSEAKQAGLDPATLNPKYWTWKFFQSQLRRSFGSKDQKEIALKSWDALKHTGTIDEFCDELERLMWMVNFNQAAIEHKIKSSLKYELRKDWAKVHNKPTALQDQLSMLREMGRPIEEFNKDNRKPEKTTTTTTSSTGGKRKREGESSSQAAKKSKAESRPFGRFASKEVALKGIPKEVLDQRMSDKVYWRCGRSNHRAMDCGASAPVTAKVAASGGKGKKKEAAAVSTATGEQAEDQLVVAGSSSRIMELSTNDEMADA